MFFDVYPFIQECVHEILIKEKIVGGVMERVKWSDIKSLLSRKCMKTIDEIVDNFLLELEIQIINSVSSRFVKSVGKMHAFLIKPRFSITEPSQRYSFDENEHHSKEKKKEIVFIKPRKYLNLRTEVAGVPTCRVVNVISFVLTFF